MFKGYDPLLFFFYYFFNILHNFSSTSITVDSIEKKNLKEEPLLFYCIFKVPRFQRKTLLFCQVFFLLFSLLLFSFFLNFFFEIFSNNMKYQGFLSRTFLFMTSLPDGRYVRFSFCKMWFCPLFFCNKFKDFFLIKIFTIFPQQNMF